MAKALLWIILSSDPTEREVISRFEKTFWGFLALFSIMLLFAIALILYIGIPKIRGGYGKWVKKAAKPTEGPIKNEKKERSIIEHSELYAAIETLNQEYVELQIEYAPVYEDEVNLKTAEEWELYQASDYIAANQDKIKAKIEERFHLLGLQNEYARKLNRLFEEHAEIKEQEKSLCLSLALPSLDLSPLLIRVKVLLLNQKRESKSIVISENSAKRIFATLETKD